VKGETWVDSERLKWDREPGWMEEEEEEEEG
jgi:hypothetical protein